MDTTTTTWRLGGWDNLNGAFPVARGGQTLYFRGTVEPEGGSLGVFCRHQHSSQEQAARCAERMLAATDGGEFIGWTLMTNRSIYNGKGRCTGYKARVERHGQVIECEHLHGSEVQADECARDLRWVTVERTLLAASEPTVLPLNEADAVAVLAALEAHARVLNVVGSPDATVALNDLRIRLAKTLRDNLAAER